MRSRALVHPDRRPLRFPVLRTCILVKLGPGPAERTRHVVRSAPAPPDAQYRAPGAQIRRPFRERLAMGASSPCGDATPVTATALRRYMPARGAGGPRLGTRGFRRRRVHGRCARRPGGGVAGGRERAAAAEVRGVEDKALRSLIQQAIGEAPPAARPAASKRAAAPARPPTRPSSCCAPRATTTTTSSRTSARAIRPPPSWPSRPGRCLEDRRSAASNGTGRRLTPRPRPRRRPPWR